MPKEDAFFDDEKPSNATESKVSFRLPKAENVDGMIAWLNQFLIQTNQLKENNVSQTVLWVIKYQYNLFTGYVDYKDKGGTNTKFEIDLTFLENPPSASKKEK